VIVAQSTSELKAAVVARAPAPTICTFLVDGLSDHPICPVSSGAAKTISSI
jgi:hypothetical protein